MMEKIEKLKDFYLEKKFLIDCILLSILFFVNAFLNIFTYFSFTLLFILVLTSDLKNAISYVFFSVAYCAIDMLPSVILFLVCTIICVVRLCTQKFYIEKHKINKKILVICGILLAFLLFPFKNIYNPIMFAKIAFIFIVLFILYLLVNFASEFRLKINMRYMAYGLLISCIYALFVKLVAPGVRSIGLAGSPFRFMALTTNPNSIAIMCEIALSILAYFIVRGNYRRKDIVAFVIFALIGLTSASKTYMILLALILFLMFIFNAKRVNKNGWILIGVFAGLAILFAIIKFDLILSMLGRFVRTDVSGMNFEQFINIFTTSRFELWKGYVRFLLENPVFIIFGRGLGAPVIGETSCHNMYLSSMYQIGIVGMALIVATLILIVKDAKKQGKILLNKGILIPILVCAALACIEDLIFFIF